MKLQSEVAPVFRAHKGRGPLFGVLPVLSARAYRKEFGI